MFKNKKETKEIILNFEKEAITAKDAISAIFELTGKNVEEHTLCNYWRGMGLEEFVEILTIEEIKEWQNLDDEKSIKLIQEIFDNIASNAIIERNGTALEKRYSKPTGTVWEWIFEEEIDHPMKILELLKKDMSIYL